MTEGKDLGVSDRKGGSRMGCGNMYPIGSDDRLRVAAPLLHVDAACMAWGDSFKMTND